MLNRCVSPTRSKTVIITLGFILGCLLVTSNGIWAQEIETPAETPTETPVVTPTAAPPTPTEAPVETATETPTVVPPTNTPIPPTATPVPPTATPTETVVETPTETEVPTPTPEPPTPTPEPPTPTETEVPTPTPELPTPTETEVPTPTPEPPTPTPTEVPPTPAEGDFENPNQGIAIIDGYGGLHELGDVARLTDLNGDGALSALERVSLFPYFVGRDVYRDIEIHMENGAIKAVLAMRGDGGIFTAEIGDDGKANRGYLPDLGITFSNVDAVADVEFSDDGQAYFVLMADGTLISVDKNGVQLFDRVKTPKKGVGAGAIDYRQNPAVDLEIISAADASVMPTAYVLDARGFIHPLGGAAPLTTIGAPVSNSPIYIDIEMVPGMDSAVVADGFGRFFHAVPEGANPPDIILPELGFSRSEPVLIDFEIQKDSNVEYAQGIGIMALTKIGTLHTAGAADFLLTEEGLANRADLVGLPEGVYPRVDQNATGKPFINMGILFDIIRDLELYLMGD
ncbi:MAG: hypothetical protein JXR73_18760 [Candidatus Omnitrophica bacterium]|nr:hypothetical protein [Candidatus Omnitrophota bacterium]